MLETNALRWGLNVVIRDGACGDVGQLGRERGMEGLWLLGTIWAKMGAAFLRFPSSLSF